MSSNLDTDYIEFDVFIDDIRNSKIYLSIKIDYKSS